MTIAAQAAGASVRASTSPATGEALGPRGVDVRLHPVVNGLAAPVMVTSAADGTKRLYVVEQRGTARVVVGGTLRSRIYLDLRSKVGCCGEQGLLSIAFHPDFAAHPYVFAAYTRAGDGALQVSRFTASSASARRVPAGTERRIVAVPHPGQSNHNAGQLLFGRGGLLLVSTGDGGGAGDPYDNARDLTSLSGKILRLDVDHACGRHHYCVPAGNPFAGASDGHKRLVFDWGLRNPWRMSLDRGNGRMWIADVGQDAYEEVDRTRQRGGKDFGWSCREGMSTYNADRCTLGGEPRHLTPPLHVYGHASANGTTRCAVIGGYAYRGPSYPFAHGLYVYGDYCTGELWALGRTTSGWVNAKVGEAGSTNSLTGFGENDTGEVYAVTQQGGLFHLTFHRA